MASLSLPTQNRLYTPMSQHGNKGLDARRTFELFAFGSVDFLDRINWRTRLTRQEFNCRFSRND